MKPLLALALLGACHRDNDPPKDLAVDTGVDEPIAVDGRGLAGAIGAIEWYQLIGGYWASGSASFGQAWWGLIVPRDFHYRDLYGGAPGGCVLNPSFGDLDLYDVGVAETRVVTEGVDLRMTLARDGFFEAEVRASEFIPGRVYDLTALSGGPLAGLAIADLARTPAPPALTAPALGGDELITLGRNDLSFTWTPSGADEVYIQIDRARGGEVVESVGCVVPDDGARGVPGDLFTGWDEGEFLYIYVGNASQGRGLVPLNDADSRVMGISWVMAAAVAG